MLPTSNNQFSDQHSPKKSNTFLLKNTFTSIRSQYALRLTCWLLITVLLQALLILFLARDSSTPPLPKAQKQLEQFSAPKVQKQRQQFSAPIEEHEKSSCGFGKVFVYDLPPIFNKDFVSKCHDLDPWKSRCNVVTNGGFGPKATGLEGVVPQNLAPAWYWTDMYAGEVIYHVRMMDYKCRTSNPNEATAFYVPFYAGLAVGKYLWYSTTKDRDRLFEMLLNWLKDQPSWKKTNGSEHFLMLGRLTWDFRRVTNNDADWGTSFYSMPLMKNVLRISVERDPWDPLEISVPYPTAFHPRSESDISDWQSYVRGQKRNRLFCFVGATRKKIKNDFRAVLMKYCKNEKGSCGVVDCSERDCYDGAPAILEAFLHSDFCLQPKGDGSTRRSFFDCMLAGSIPVYFWQGSFQDQYEWHMPFNAETYSVLIDHNDVRNDSTVIKTVLERFSRAQVRKMRETVIDLIPRFLYARSSKGLENSKDAFDITIERVLRKFHYQKKKQQQQQEQQQKA